MSLELYYRKQFTSDALLGRVTDFVTYEANTGTQLYAAFEASANVARFDLDAGQGASLNAAWSIPVRGTQMRPLDLEIVGAGGSVRLVVSGTQTTQVETASIANNGALSSAGRWTVAGDWRDEVSQFTPIMVDGTQFIATGSRDSAGLTIYEQTSTSKLAPAAILEDHGKAALADTADMVTITVGSASYLVTGSAGDGGISTFQIAASGQATLVDTIGVKQQLWLSGLDDLVTVEAAGVDYVAIAATNSSSLSLVRVNPLGVMFVTDHLNDDQNSRFANVDAIDSFEIGNRGFVVAGGSDDGVSLLEILPDGTFFTHDSLANQAGWALEDISALKAEVLGSEVQIFAGSTHGSVTQLGLDMSGLGAAQIGGAGANSLTGTSADDLLVGGTGNDTLNGGAGDDLLVGMGGADQMTGGAGADIFVFGKGTSRIMDFTLGEDRIDVSDWGRLYHISSLTVDARNYGAEIRFGDQVLRIDSHDDSRLEADALADSFLF